MSQKSQTPQQRLAALGLELPDIAAPAANYIAWRRVGDVLYVAGQVPFVDGRLPVTGKLGGVVGMEEGRRQAGVAALNALAAGARAAGSLERLVVAHVQVFVASTPEFTDQHLVANGASDLLAEVLGEAGRHPRTAIAVPVLPLDAPVEIQVTFTIADAL
ncbi:RidA family protein [Nocardioides sp. LHD-245]|uniref:RidA family protein n=1 Tax=Nocardioides sp. LHD-245 TaxID=3051387 RepID=UPI0027E1DF4F|nr:RidA family protein [Nocardioides sp. LHD-245]